uniref:alpha-amylase n=1 Tax=Thraustotheca clavata TaxID=74557 RepID=A0A0A7CMG2_9STRA|nr:secreted protein [Thraustotheca clavata]
MLKGTALFFAWICVSLIQGNDEFIQTSENIAAARDTAAWKQRTVYQVLTDRFAGGSRSDLGSYCGGTFNGLKNNLKYIKDMGFDAIWISPVTDNIDNGYHGYWFKNFEKINSHFGTADDLKNLVATAHQMDIWVMVDVVANHVGPVGTNYAQIYPFNSSSHYHSSCDITDWKNQNMVENCRLSSLPDLNQDVSFVRSYLKNWVKQLVQTYGFDGIRIDTVPEVHPDFWAEYGSSAGVFQVGEVFNGDPAYVGPYQKYLTSVFNYPMYFTIADVFGSGMDMSNLQNRYNAEGSYFKDIDALGSFVDNHDNARFLNKFPEKKAQLRAANVFVLTGRGIPFVYYGTEQYFNGDADPNNREVLWTKMDTSSDFYKLFKVVNAQRKKSKIWNQPWVERYSNPNFYSFSRGEFLVALTNSNDQQHFKVTYHPFKDGQVICNIFYPTSDCQTVNGGVQVYLLNGESKIYVPKDMLA